MRERISALLVYHEQEPLESLRHSLERQSIRTIRAQSCRQARRILSRSTPPHLVFTDAALPDGVWADMIALAAKAPLPVNVIVVARVVDTRLYLEVLEGGAFDFIVPPFAAADLSHVVRCAADNALAQREAQSRAAQANEGEVFSVIPLPGLPVTMGQVSSKRSTPDRPAGKLL